MNTDTPQSQIANRKSEMSLLPWYAVAIPHEDIRKGRLEEAVFAANIWAVVQRTAPEVYLDNEEFFRKTYMTGGIGSLFGRSYWHWQRRKPFDAPDALLQTERLR